MKFLAFILVLLIVMVTGCTKVCDRNQPDLCDKSCEVDSDCMQACPIGCINKNQEYEIPTNILCERMDCKCIENMCTEVEPSFD